MSFNMWIWFQPLQRNAPKYGNYNFLPMQERSSKIISNDVELGRPRRNYNGDGCTTSPNHASFAAGAIWAIQGKIIKIIPDNVEHCRPCRHEWRWMDYSSTEYWTCKFQCWGDLSRYLSWTSPLKRGNSTVVTCTCCSIKMRFIGITCQPEFQFCATVQQKQEEFAGKLTCKESGFTAESWKCASPSGKEWFKWWISY